MYCIVCIYQGIVVVVCFMFYVLCMLYVLYILGDCMLGSIYVVFYGQMEGSMYVYMYVCSYVCCMLGSQEGLGSFMVCQEVRKYVCIVYMYVRKYVLGEVFIRVLYGLGDCIYVYIYCMYILGEVFIRGSMLYVRKEVQIRVLYGLGGLYVFMDQGMYVRKYVCQEVFRRRRYVLYVFIRGLLLQYVLCFMF